MSDIVDRLRGLVILDEVMSDNPLGRDAADLIVYLRQQLEEARERNLFANNRADNAEADAAKARAKAFEEAAREAESSPVNFEGRDIAAGIRALGASTLTMETDTKPHTPAE